MHLHAEGQTPDLFGSLPTTSESLLLSCDLLVSPFSVFRQQDSMILLSSENVLEGDQSNSKAELLDTGLPGNYRML